MRTLAALTILFVATSGASLSTSTIEAGARSDDAAETSASQVGARSVGEPVLVSWRELCNRLLDGRWTKRGHPRTSKGQSVDLVWTGLGLTWSEP